MSDCSLPPIPRGTRYREGPLASVQRGYEEDAVLVLKLVVQLTQQFPVGIINQHQNPWPPVGKVAVSSRE